LFSSDEELKELRAKANDTHKAKYRAVLDDPEQEDDFLTPQEEALLCRIVTEAGIRFGDDFRPVIWPSVRWIAFAYFKRFYLRQSAMEFFPKNVMMACYYLAMKVDEFNVSIDKFADNLRNGIRQNNIETILTLETELMLLLNYQLTVHCPFRPFEGHMIDIKTKCKPKFDPELIRPYAMEFFTKALIGDVMILYPPSQIALAAVTHGLQRLEKPTKVFRGYLLKLLSIDEQNEDDLTIVEKLQERLEAICKEVSDGAVPLNPDDSKALQARMTTMHALQTHLDERIKPIGNNNKEQLIDSDDDV